MALAVTVAVVGAGVVEAWCLVRRVGFGVSDGGLVGVVGVGSALLWRLCRCEYGGGQQQRRESDAVDSSVVSQPRNGDVIAWFWGGIRAASVDTCCGTIEMGAGICGVMDRPVKKR